MNFNEVFKVRAIKKNEEDIYVITIGNRLASEEEFKTAQKAQMKIDKIDWNLVASLFAAMLEGEKKTTRRKS